MIFSSDDLPSLQESRKQIAALRVDAHIFFDQLWQEGPLTRDEAYDWLAHEMDLRPDLAHFKRMNHEQCCEAIRLVKQKLADVM